MSSTEQWIEGMFKKHLPELDKDQAWKLLGGASASGELQQCGSPESWFKDRAGFSTVMLNDIDYITALTHSLRIAPGLAATDYGTSRQRDLGQLWTDVARGFLGEIGLSKFVNQRFGAELMLDYTLGPIEDYLPSDIKGIRLQDGKEVHPKLKVSFKTTKFNGIWLDVPGAQITYSHIFVLIKLGISRVHFVSFLKSISFIKDKLLPQAMEIGTIEKAQAQELWDTLPDFKNIPCYIAGFLDRELIESPPSPIYRPMHKRDRTLKGYRMQKYVGWVKDKKPKGVPIHLENENWEFEAIGAFSAEDHFVATSGFLKYSEQDWKAMLGEVIGEKLG